MGDEAAALRHGLEVTYPVDNGVIRNWDDMELLWNYTFSCVLRALPHPFRARAALPSCSPPLHPPLHATHRCGMRDGGCGFSCRPARGGARGLAVARGCVCAGARPRSCTCACGGVRASSRAGYRERAVSWGSVRARCSAELLVCRGVSARPMGHVSLSHGPPALPCLLCRWYT